jgi:hypothetical protein
LRRNCSISVMQVVARRQPLLVDHRLQALDVLPRRLLDRGGRIEARPELARLGLERARRDVDAQVRPDRAQERQRGGRIRPET